MSSQPPIAICGRGEKIAGALLDRLASDYDVVHLCLSHPAALEEIPAILKGDLVAPSSNIGSNVTRDLGERIAPRVLFLGGGITEEENNELKEKVGEDAQKVIWLKARMQQVIELGGPSLDNIETVVRGMLKGADI